MITSKSGPFRSRPSTQIVFGMMVVMGISVVDGLSQEQPELEGFRESLRHQVIPSSVPASYKIFLFRYMGMGRDLIDESQALDLLEVAADLWEKNEPIEQVLNLTQVLGIPDQELSNLWLSGSILQQGSQMRHLLTADVAPGSTPQREDSFTDGGFQVQYVKESNQVGYYTEGGGWYPYSPSEFFPTLSPNASIAETTDVPMSGVKRYIFNRDFRVDYDAIHKAVLRITKPNAAYFKHQRFAAHAERDIPSLGKTLVPMYIGSATISDGIALGVEICFVRSADFPSGLEPKEFAIIVPAGTIAVLFSPGAKKNSLVTQRLPHDLADAREYFAVLQDAAQKKSLHARGPIENVQPVPVNGPSRFVWVLALNSIGILFILVAMLWSRHRKTS